ncbi:uncharacterized protein LOC135497790 isoform X2 [Lineus longissimus]|uniref:uncharacterized protein LOC135497790 isoform X2 n=1 Tax=Lineus longissimus TaxID=88925 RepID=UPI00315DD6B2
MATTYGDVNRGPLTLKHDVTPRDFTKYKPSFNEIMMETNHRFKGFPTNSMISPREPIRGGGLDDPHLRLFAQTRHFDKGKMGGPYSNWYNHYNYLSKEGKPAIDEGHYSIRYGEQIPVDSGTPKPIAGALYPERSSAEHRKFRKHQIEAEDDLQKFKMEKLQKALNQGEEKKKDWEMLQEYNPWGRPGGGAPKQPDNRKQKFGEEELHTSQVSPRKGDEQFHDSFGRPGGGAPLRTNSGHLKTEISGDPNIRFHQAENNHVVRQQIGENMRYVTRQERGRKYANELDQQIVQRALTEQEQRISDLKQEYEMMKHHPYGRPGAGAPNLSQSGNVKNHGKSWHRYQYQPNEHLDALLEERRKNDFGDENLPPFSHRDWDTWQQPYDSPRRNDLDEQPRKIARGDENKNVYDPWGKGYGGPVRDSRGNVINSRRSDGKNGINEFEDQRARGATLNKFGDGEGGGAPTRTESGHIRTTHPITLRADERGAPFFTKPYSPPSKETKSELSIKEEIPGQRSGEEPSSWYPFGTAGGGAPNRDANGNIITHIYAKETLERDSADQRRKARNAREYLNELESERDEQHQKMLEEKRYRRAPIGEFARIVKDGQVGKPKRDPYTGELGNQALPMTDVTKDRTGYVSQKNDSTRDYHTHLQRAAEERHRLRRMDGYKEKQESRQHHEVFGEFFGRPGGGAPNPAGPRRHDTDEVVHSPRKDHPTYYDNKDWWQYKSTKPNTDNGYEKHDYVKSYDPDFVRKSYESPRQFEDGDLPSSYIRSTVNSKHDNQYEYYVPQEPLSKAHQVDIPYATH